MAKKDMSNLCGVCNEEAVSKVILHNTTVKVCEKHLKRFIAKGWKEGSPNQTPL